MWHHFHIMHHYFHKKGLRRPSHVDIIITSGVEEVLLSQEE